MGGGGGVKKSFLNDGTSEMGGNGKFVGMSIFMTCFALDILRKNLGSVQHKKSLCYHLSVLQAKKILKTLDMH